MGGGAAGFEGGSQQRAIGGEAAYRGRIRGGADRVHRRTGDLGRLVGRQAEIVGGAAGFAGQENGAELRGLAAQRGAGEKAGYAGCGRSIRGESLRSGSIRGGGVLGAAGAEDQDVSGALGQGGAVGDGFRYAGVVEAAAGDDDGRAGQQGQRGAGPQGQAQSGGIADERTQVGGLAGGGVGGQRMELDRAGQHGGEVHRERGLVQILDQGPDVGDRAAAQRRRTADQRPGVGRLGPAV